SVTIHVHRNLPDCLDRVAVKQHATLMTKPANLCNRLEHANFIIGVHDADENRLIRERCFQIFEAEQAIARDQQVSDAITLFFQTLAAIEHSLMLAGNSNNVVALVSAGLGYAFDREIVALGRSRGEDDLLRVSANQLCDLLAGSLNCLLCFPAKLMAAAGCIAKLLREVGEHRFEDPRINLCGGVVVEIDRKLHLLKCNPSGLSAIGGRHSASSAG